MTAPRILASAYSCEPGLGSEPGIGWNWARQIAQRGPLLLVTRENNVDAIVRQASAEGLTDMQVVGFDLPGWARWWKRGPRGAMAYYWLWQRALGGFCRRLLAREHVDITHHLTFASSWIGSGLANVDRPLVWGPVGQHPRVPARFLAKGDLRLHLAERGKAAARATGLGFDPLTERTLRKARLILSLGDEFAHRLPPEHRHKLVPMLACGVDPPQLSERRFQRSGPLEVLFAGRLVDLKGVTLALEAFGRLIASGVDATLTVAGDGPRRPRLEARTSELGLSDRVRFLGNVQLNEVQSRMRRADVFLFPSFEGAGMVVVEAQASGCPVVCLDFGGPGEMVGTERGLRAAVAETYEQTAAGLGDCLIQLAEDEPLRLSMARQAYAWARVEASWDAKGARLPALYERALERPAPALLEAA